MKKFLVLTTMAIALMAVGSPAQRGGKAEPSRIRFENGRSNITVTGRLANHQEMEYVFAARQGQTVTIRNSRPSQFDFRVFRPENDFETEFESSRSLTFEIPETGDYLFFVRKRATAAKSARFSLSITIK
jgi:hypothetical protein